MRFLIGVLFVGTFVLGLLWIAQGEESAPPRGAISTSSAAIGIADLRIDLWVDKSRVLVGKPLTCTITVINPYADAPVEEFRLVTLNHENLVAARSEKGVDCWKNDGPVCTEVSGAAVMTGIGSRIEPGQIIRIVAPFASGETGRSTIGALFSWRIGKAWRSKSVNTGPILIEQWWSAAGRAIRTFVKDVGWPVVLALLGYFFKKAEEAQTRLRETWNLMFPLSHSRNEKYWMPLSNTVESFLRARQEHQDDRAFAYLVLFWRQMVDASGEIGGFFMKAHVAEEVLSSSWLIVLAWSKEVFGDDRERVTMALEKAPIAYLEFEETYALRTTFRRALQTFKAQSVNGNIFDLITAVLEVFVIVLDHEINRAYTGWYEDTEQFDISELDGPFQRIASARHHYATAVMPGVSVPGMERIRAGIDLLLEEITRYRSFLLKSRRRKVVGDLFA